MEVAMKGQFAPQFDYAPDRGLLVRKFDKSAILTVASWPKDGGSALALGAVGTSRACATEKSFFFFSYYYYYWGVPPEACPLLVKGREDDGIVLAMRYR